MLPKPTQCQRCPFYQTGQGFVHDSPCPDGALMLCFEYPGPDEVAGMKIQKYVWGNKVSTPVTPQPALGAVGYMVTHTLLPLVKWPQAISMMHALRCRPPKQYSKRDLLQALQCCRQYDVGQPRAVLALGDIAAIMVSPLKEYSVESWSGYELPVSYRQAPVMLLRSPADFFKRINLFTQILFQWRRAGAWLRGEWPQPVPSRAICPTEVSIEKGIQLLETPHPNRIACDTEYLYKKSDIMGRHPLTMIGFAWNENGQVDGVQFDWRCMTEAQRNAVIQSLHKCVRYQHFIFQNAQADLAVLHHAGGPAPDQWRFDDIMLLHHCLESEQPHDLEYLASIHGLYPHGKHLTETDLLLYNWHDCIETLAIWEALTEHALPRPYTEQLLPLVPILLTATQTGIPVQHEQVVALREKYQHIKKEALHIAWCAAGIPINLGSLGPRGQLRALMPSLKKGTNKDSIAKARMQYNKWADQEEEAREGLSVDTVMAYLKQGAHPILEARILYGHASHLLSFYLDPLVESTRIHPRFHIHAQANHRWSTVAPALATFPPDLEAILGLDPGQLEIGWDWDQQELRILAVLAQDQALLESFANKWDVHTLHTCEVFGLPYPPDRVDPHFSNDNREWREQVAWQGKKDKRRLMGKNFVYSLCYGKHPRNMMSIPGAHALGMDATQFEAAARRFLAIHTGIAAWQRKIQSSTSTVSVTPFGTCRRTYLRGHEKTRAMMDHPIQATAADLLNLTIIKLSQNIPQVHLRWTKHDAVSLWVQECDFTPDLLGQVQAIAEYKWIINGYTLQIPATMYVRKGGA